MPGSTVPRPAGLDKLLGYVTDNLRDEAAATAEEVALLEALKGKAHALQARHDARTRAAAYREVAALIDCDGCDSCHVQDVAGQLRTRADEIAPPAPDPEAPASDPGVGPGDELRPDDDTLMRFPTSGDIARAELLRIQGVARNYRARTETAGAALARVRAQCAEWARPIRSGSWDARIRDDIAASCAQMILQALDTPAPTDTTAKD
jgi:hypothetical protein